MYNNIQIGMTGFEPAAPSSRTKCATKLRYIPKIYSLTIIAYPSRPRSRLGKIIQIGSSGVVTA